MGILQKVETWLYSSKLSENLDRILRIPNGKMGVQTDKVRFNVRGKIFETTATTLASAGRSSMFGAMFDDDWNLRPREVNEEYFIDRNPECFSVLLNLLGTGELHVPPHIPDKLVYTEALYYGLIDHVRTARSGEFDGNRLILKSSVKRQASDYMFTAIRASPDGGCAVAHDRIVRLYDWMLEEYPTINLNYQKVNDICWMDQENVVISACERSGRQDSGIGLFSSSRGDLKHSFQLSHENQVKSFTVGALCCNSDGKVFAACSGTGVNGIGVWDQVTGEQTDLFDKTKNEPLCDANRIQCLDGNNCLLIYNLSRAGNSEKYISLLDLRDKSTVWHVTSVSGYEPPLHPYRSRVLDGVLDGVAMEGSNSICVVDQYEEFGFMDFRSTRGGIRWILEKKQYRKVEVSYPKLALHGGKLFSCMNDRISMFCGPDWFLTSSLRRSCSGGAIRDFSIGGDRLFALHSEENMFDVWETPVPPNRAG